MRLMILCLCVLFGREGFLRAESPSQALVVVIPSYNNRSWYVNNLDSVLAQTYAHYRVIYIDDASTDETGDLVERYLQDQEATPQITLIKNRHRVGSLANLYQAIGTCAPHEIIVTLDGDDWFAHANVLDRIAHVYQDPHVWMTYGQFVWYPSGHLGFARAVPQEVLQSQTLRQYDWVTTHLRTFYAGLFHKIQLPDLLYQGSFFPMAGDLAFMWPLIEMAGVHSRFIPDILYVYNNATPLNDHKVNLLLQMALTQVIRAKPSYKPLDTLFLPLSP